MLTRRITVSRRARTAARLPDHSRPHGRRRGYDHVRPDPWEEAAGAKGPPLLAVLILGSVFAFLLLVVSGVLAPKPGPLVKHEPVSTARVK